jgi:DNA-binding transcriptional ArsR family regulator
MPRPAATEDVFRAVADPTRRAALEILGRRRDVPVSALAGELGVGLPMLSRHLAVLRAAGLVTERRDGRQRRYRIEPEPLRELYDWAAIFRDFWPEKIDNLRSYLDRVAKDET